MQRNIGTPDRIFRLVLGIVLLVYGAISVNFLPALLGIFSVYEAFAGWCALYQLIGRNTCPIKQK